MIQLITVSQVGFQRIFAGDKKKLHFVETFRKILWTYECPCRANTLNWRKCCCLFWREKYSHPFVTLRFQIIRLVKTFAHHSLELNLFCIFQMMQNKIIYLVKKSFERQDYSLFYPSLPPTPPSPSSPIDPPHPNPTTKKIYPALSV